MSSKLKDEEEELSEQQKGLLESTAEKDETAATKASKGSAEIAWAIGAYACCSASLLVINKVAVSAIPSASFVLICQFAASVAAVLGLSITGVLDNVEPLSWSKIKPFMGISLLFCACLWTNVKALEYANVETVIVFRAMSPIAVALCDWWFLGQSLPSTRSWLSLAVIVLGAILYVVTDDGFQVKAYMWVMMYFVSITAEMVYVKFVVESLEMTTWGRVYYNNVLSIPPTLMLGLAFGEFDELSSLEWNSGQVGAVLLSCVVGVGISYAGFNLRKMVTATSFTVIGVLCKIASVLLNIFIWDKHANAIGITALCICIFAGTFYQQSGKR